MIRTNKTEIRRALLTASRDETHLAGVQFAREKGVLRVVATDGHRLTVMERREGAY